MTAALACVLTRLDQARQSLPPQLHRIVDTLIDVAAQNGALSLADLAQAQSLIDRAGRRRGYPETPGQAKPGPNLLHCYECDRVVNYIFDDGRGYCCTRLTEEEVTGGKT